jgi:enoyl-CoA hydratase/carnithine racemase
MRRSSSRSRPRRPDPAQPARRAERAQPELLASWPKALARGDANDKVRCIVLTGSEKAFAAGADIKEMADKTFVDAFGGDFFGAEAGRRSALPQADHRRGGGLCAGRRLRTGDDVRFHHRADTAKFGQPEINLGVIPGIGGTQRLTRFVGKSKSMDMNLTGRFMDAAEAERSGLVSRVVPAKKLMDEAMAPPAKIAEKSPRGDGGQGGGEPRLRDHAARGAAVRAAAVPRAVRHRGPVRRHGGLPRKARGRSSATGWPRNA